MKRDIRFGNAVLCLGILLITGMIAPSHAQQTARVSKLIEKDDWQLVQAICTNCHTAQIIVQNSGSRSVWKSRLIWMQETQGLGQLSVDVENSILDYLAGNYGQKTSTRRPGLAEHLLPTNPYTNTN